MGLGAPSLIPSIGLIIAMRITEIIWKDRFVEKLAQKHHVSIAEAEEVLDSQPLIRRVSKGRVKGEDVYIAYGQTADGRYLVVFFIHKGSGVILPISARDMDAAERKYYGEQK